MKKRNYNQFRVTHICIYNYFKVLIYIPRVLALGNFKAASSIDAIRSK